MCKTCEETEAEVTSGRGPDRVKLPPRRGKMTIVFQHRDVEVTVTLEGGESMMRQRLADELLSRYGVIEQRSCNCAPFC